MNFSLRSNKASIDRFPVNKFVDCNSKTTGWNILYYTLKAQILIKDSWILTHKYFNRYRFVEIFIKCTNLIMWRCYGKIKEIDIRCSVVIKADCLSEGPGPMGSARHDSFSWGTSSSLLVLSAKFVVKILYAYNTYLVFFVCKMTFYKRVLWLNYVFYFISFYTIYLYLIFKKMLTFFLNIIHNFSFCCLQNAFKK